MNGAGLFFLLLFLLVIIPAVAFVGWTRWNAHKHGLPPPPLSEYNPLKFFKKNGSSSSYGGGAGGGGGGGPIGWVKDKFSSLRDHRAGQGYAGQTRGARGFGPLDPDAAWDDRVALEADGVDEYGHHHPGGRQQQGYGHDRDDSVGGYGGGGGGYEEQELGIPRQSTGGLGATDHGPYGMHSGQRSAMPAYGSEERGRSRSREDLSYHHGAAESMDRHELDARYDAATGRDGSHSNDGQLRGLSPRPAESPSPKYERRSVFRENV